MSKKNKWNFKNILKELAIGATILFVVSNTISYIRKPELESNQLPNLNVVSIHQKQFKQDKKPLLVHFWATWCPTCKLEASNIDRISKNYRVVTFAVKSGSDDELKTYMKNRGYTFFVVNDSGGKWAKKFNIEAFPSTFVYDANKTLKFTEVGYTTTAGLLARMAAVSL